MNRRCAISLVFALFACATTSFAADRTSTVVVLPFDNFSGIEQARGEVADLVAKAITAKGWTVVTGDAIEPILQEERVRYLDSLDEGVRARIVEKSGAGAIVTGGIYAYNEGRDATVAIVARMVRLDGSVVWGNAVGLASSDTEEVFGLGKKMTRADVSKSAVDRLFAAFPRPGAKSTVEHGESKPLLHRGARTYRAEDLNTAPRRICILPFENDSPTPEATRIVADLLSLRLDAAGFDVIEPAELRSAALSTNIGSLYAIGSEQLKKLGTALHTSLFIRGTIYDYSTTMPNGMPRPPKLDVELSLVDVTGGRVLWAAQHERNGTDYAGFLMLGAISNPVTLADRVLSEMVEAGMHSSSWSTAALVGRTSSKRIASRRFAEKHSELSAPKKDGEQ